MLDAEEVRRERLPRAAAWFRYLVPNPNAPSLLQYLADLPEPKPPCFLVAWHSPFLHPTKRRPVPLFGAFPSLQAFLETSYAADTTRHGLEIVRNEIDAKAFADYDREVPLPSDAAAEQQLQAQALQTLQAHLQALEQRVRAWFGITPVFCVSECFRATAKGYKLSFHLVICNLVFAPRNLSDDKRMLVLFHGLPHNDALGWDDSVYSSNRQMRMAGHSKASAPDHPLRMLWQFCSIPPSDDLGLITAPPPASAQCFRIVSQGLSQGLSQSLSQSLSQEQSLTQSQSLSQEQSQGQGQGQGQGQRGGLEQALQDYHARHNIPLTIGVGGGGRVARSKRQRTAHHDDAFTGWLLPRAQRLLRLCGDRTTRVRGAVHAHCFECNNQGRPRVCLLHPARDVQHDSNHCRLFVTLAPCLTAYAIEYTCMSKRCPAKPRVALLGTVDRATGTLRPALLPLQPEPAAEDDEDVEEDEEEPRDQEEPEHAPPMPATQAMRAEAAREVLLAAPHPEVVAILKLFDPLVDDETRALVLEWGSRLPEPPTEEQLLRLLEDTPPADAYADHHAALLALHRARTANPLLVLTRHSEARALDGEPAPERRALRGILNSILGTYNPEWRRVLRALRQLFPDEGDYCISRLMGKYSPDREAAMRAAWAQPSYVPGNPHLRSQAELAIWGHPLLCETLPSLLGCAVRAYELKDDGDTLDIQLDRPPYAYCRAELAQGVIQLCHSYAAAEPQPQPEQRLEARGGQEQEERGRQEQEESQKRRQEIHVFPIHHWEELFHGDQHVDYLLADVIHDRRLCHDALLVDADAPAFPSARDRYMHYQPASGAWAPVAEACAADVISTIIKRLLRGVFHWQHFRELQLPPVPPTSNAEARIRPTSVQVRKILNFYGTARNVRDVLRALDKRLEASFARDPERASYLVFADGVVRLDTGQFLGPAAPALRLTQWVPHPFPRPEQAGQWDAYWRSTVASFFPAACYEDHGEVERFFQKWCGLLLTEDMRVQKSLWVTGHGSNGKSVLSKIMALAHGRRILHTLDIDALGVKSTLNNDSLYNARNARAVLIEENKENRQFDTKVFKKLVTGNSFAFTFRFLI